MGAKGEEERVRVREDESGTNKNKVVFAALHSLLFHLVFYYVGGGKVGVTNHIDLLHAVNLC